MVCSQCMYDIVCTDSCNKSLVLAAEHLMMDAYAKKSYEGIKLRTQAGGYRL
jgi:hypothetical protein